MAPARPHPPVDKKNHAAEIDILPFRVRLLGVARKAGDVDLLGWHFPVTVVDPIRCATQEVVSSSRIRHLRAEGAREQADRIHGCSGPGALLEGRMALDQSQLSEGTHG